MFTIGSHQILPHSLGRARVDAARRTRKAFLKSFSDSIRIQSDFKWSLARVSTQRDPATPLQRGRLPARPLGRGRPAPGPGLLRSSLGLTRGGRAAPALLEPPYRRSVSRPGRLRRLCLGGFALAPLNPLLPARRLDRRSSQGVCVCGRARAEVDWWAHTRRCRLRGALPPRHRTRPVPGADTGLSVTRAHRPGRLPGFEWLSRRPCRGSAGHQRPTRGTCPAPTPASPTRDAAPHAFQWRGLPGH